MTSIFEPDLQMFADAAAAGGDTGAGDSGADAVSGEQRADAAPTEGTEPSNESRQDAYKKVRSDFKSEIDSEIQGIVKNRLKTANEKIRQGEELQSKVDKMIGVLSGLYGTDNVDEIISAMEQDDRYFEDQALEENLSVAQVKELRRLKNENAALKANAQRAEREQSERDRLERERAVFNKLTQDAQSLKKLYPNFELNAELSNEEFRRLVRNGVGLQTAYEVIHRNEIVPSLMQSAANEAAQKVAASVAANNARPAENGMKDTAAATHGVDVSKLDYDAIQAINERVRLGEKIYL